MKSLTLLLTGLMLLLGMATAGAETGPYTSGSTAFASGDAGLSLHDPVADIAPPVESTPEFAVNSDEGLTAVQSLTVWDYAISPQITFDLEYRPLGAADNSSDLRTDIGSAVDLDYLTQNLMLGVRYSHHF